MKTIVVLPLLLLVGLHNLDAQLAETLIQQEERNIKDSQLRLADDEAHPRTLQSHIETIVSHLNLSDSQRKKLVIDETRHLLVARHAYLHDEKALLLKLKRPATRKTIDSIDKDHRRPGKNDLSGVWFSIVAMTTYTFQLEQRGKLITGRGYLQGAPNKFELFKITGSTEASRLSLTLLWPSGLKQEHRYRRSPHRGRLQFQELRVDGPTILLPRDHTRSSP